MGTKKRFTPEEDFERLAERIWLNKKGKITDEKSFNREFDNYLDQSLSSKQDRSLRKRIFTELRSNHPSIRIGKKAKKSSKKQIASGYILTGYIKGRQVHVKETTYKIREKEVTRLRDEKGRFARSIK